ncbi:MAG: bifunctional precorrin-2 dehydrogenase/sirohydrochlorin ferrochelatase [Bacteroidetes bacterium]|nr:MAG: bifunctional precorrin-2 dehydrogenase/sirohydrochlorin ferrochelatase [Bacteroidota bacterium]
MSNQLYPVFLKLHELELLLVGGGKVAHEKLFFLLKNSPEAEVTLVANQISKEVKGLVKKRNAKVRFLEKDFESSDLDGKNVVIAATNDKSTNIQIRREAKKKNVLVNVADDPELCDFYLGSIVTKGDLKLAFSTNGKSPTLAKRLRQLFEKELPEDIEELTINLNRFRNTLKVDFDKKVKTLNNLTRSLLTTKN